MIIYVEIPVPASWEIGPETRVEVVDGASVVDPAVGEIGKITSARIEWGSDGNSLRLVVDVDDDSAIAAATRRSLVF